MKYEQLNKKIIELVGGKENIQAVAHCVTRLRLSLHDRSKANTQEIKKLDGVIDVVDNDVAYQIVVGTHVSDLYNEFMEMTQIKTQNKNTPRQKGIKGIVQEIFVVISETMSSIIEVLLAAGLLAGFLAILTMSGLLSEESPTYHIFSTLQQAVFYFLPILVAAASAKRLHVNQYIAIVLAATLLSNGINGVEGLSVFGISIQPITYSNSFIPILLAVWLLSVVTKFLLKIIPKYLQYFLVPVTSMLIVLPITLLLFGPIGDVIGSGLDIAFKTLESTIGNWVVVMVYAAFQPFLIVLGAGNFTAPIILESLSQYGYDPIILHAATISDIAVAGAMLGYFLRAKQEKEKQFLGTVTFSAIMGITEPAVFGAFLKYRRPFIAVIVGGGIGGLIAGLAGVKTYGYVWGLASLPTYLKGDMANFVFMVISVSVAFIVAAIVAYGLDIPKIDEDSIVDVGEIKSVTLEKVASGQVVPIQEVADKAFASLALGKGIGIVPELCETSVYAPMAGEISVVFPTKHAYGIRSENGIEVLIHIGIDTVHLEGKYFESFVAVGQSVHAGEKLATYDAMKVKEAGFDPVIMVVVTNTNDFLDVIIDTNEQMKVIL